MASGHSATGALLAGLTAPLIPSPMPPAVAVGAGMLAGAYLALVMDLDTKGKAYYLLIPFSWILKPLFVGISKLLFQLTRGDDDPESTSGHRMWTHQPAFAGMLAIVALILTWGSGWEWWLAGVVFVGVWAHRPGDACTEHGVPPGLVHVIIRMITGEAKVWRTVGVPRKLRFVTGGGKRKISSKPFVKRKGRKLTVWDRIGEEVVTFVLSLACVVLAVAVVAGYYPVVLS